MITREIIQILCGILRNNKINKVKVRERNILNAWHIIWNLTQRYLCNNVLLLYFLINVYYSMNFFPYLAYTTIP